MKKLIVIFAVIMGGFIAFNSCSDDVVEGGNDVKTTRTVTDMQRCFRFWFNYYPKSPSYMLYTRNYNMKMIMYVTYFGLKDVERYGPSFFKMGDTAQIAKNWDPKSTIDCKEESMFFRDEYNGSITFDTHPMQLVRSSLSGTSENPYVRIGHLVEENYLDEENSKNLHPTLVVCMYNANDASDRIVVAIKYNCYYMSSSTEYKYLFGPNCYNGDVNDDYVRVLCDSLKM